MKPQTGRLQLGLMIGFALYMVSASLFATSFSQGENNRNVTVDTQVNITESIPELLHVIIEGGDTNVTLNAGTFKVLECNASALDYNGGSTITANATFYATATENPYSADDNNTHYSNSSCAVTATDGYYRNFTCTFPVQYYANHGTWNCTVNVTDSYGFSDALSNFTHIDGLLALNVTPLIDFGEMAVGDISSAEEANVTNLGNLDINVTVEGYGVTIGDGLAMNCEVGDIAVQYEKYNMAGGVDPLLYTNLSSSQAMIYNLTIPQQTLDNETEFNTTYWLLEVPPNPFGICNGSVIFQAEYTS